MKWGNNLHLDNHVLKTISTRNRSFQDSEKERAIRRLYQMKTQVKQMFNTIIAYIVHAYVFGRMDSLCVLQAYFIISVSLVQNYYNCTSLYMQHLFRKSTLIQYRGFYAFLLYCKVTLIDVNQTNWGLVRDLHFVWCFLLLDKKKAVFAVQKKQGYRGF